MTLRIKKLVVLDSDGDGIHVGPNFRAEIDDLLIENSGRNGLTLHASTDFSADRVSIINSGQHGICEINNALLFQLGLPQDIDTHRFGELLVTVKNTPPDERETVIKSSFISDILAITANSSTIISNIINFTSQFSP